MCPRRRAIASRTRAKMTAFGGERCPAAEARLTDAEERFEGEERRRVRGVLGLPASEWWCVGKETSVAAARGTR